MSEKPRKTITAKKRDPTSPARTPAQKSNRRLTKEHVDLLADPLDTSVGTLGPVAENDLHHWHGTIFGPADTPYEGLAFDVTIDGLQDYPQQPPILSLATPIFHPNVSVDGEIHMAELEFEEWCPALPFRSILVCLQAMLSDPQWGEGRVLNAEAAELYDKDRRAFDLRALKWPNAGEDAVS